MSWSDLDGTDNSGQRPTITCDVDSGSQFEIGENNVTCEGRDFSGNGETCSFIVDVRGKNAIEDFEHSFNSILNHSILKCSIKIERF